MIQKKSAVSFKHLTLELLRMGYMPEGSRKNNYTFKHKDKYGGYIQLGSSINHNKLNLQLKFFQI